MDEYSVKRPLFGKDVELVVYGEEGHLAQPILDDSYEEGLRLQKTFNLYDPRSELNGINLHRSGVPSSEFREVLSRALYMSELTEGAYDISRGKGFLARKQGGEDLMLPCTFKDIRFDGHDVLLTHPDVLVDMGSIAKGYIVDRMAAILQDSGLRQGLVDGRGDIRVFGEGPQLIGIQHPRHDGLIAQIALSNGAVATSGDYNQNRGDFNRSHIVGSKELSSVTVVAPTLMEADAFATALFVTPLGLRERIIGNNPHLKVFTVDSSGEMKMYNGFQVLVVR